MSIELALAADNGYLDGLVLALASAVHSAPGISFRAYVLDCGVSDPHWSRFESFVRTRLPRAHCIRIPIPSERLAPFAPPVRHLKLNNSTYARFLLAELLPGVDRIVHLDCDLLVDADLRPLFAMDLNGQLIAAVPDRNIPRLGQTLQHGDLTERERALPSFNAGVMLMDLAALRKTDLLAPLAPVMHQLQSVVQSQAVLNYALRDRWLMLPDRWNRQFHLNPAFSLHRHSSDSIWHMFGAIKPWHFGPHRAAGIVADCHRLWRECGWPLSTTGCIRMPDGPRERLKATHAFIRRTMRRLSKPASIP